MFAQICRTAAAGFAATAVLVQAASAGGEPKNQWPFTRPVGNRTTQSATHSVSQLSPPIQGEPKNEPPFTRPIQSRTPQAAGQGASQVDPLIQGEPKNELPFTRPATIILATDRRFDWTAGGIGAAAGIGMTLAGASGLTLARKSPRSA